MTKYVKDTDLGFKRLIAELQNAKNLEVVVGLQESEEKSADGVYVAEYAAANEYGTKKIPERSFMRSTFDENVADWQRMVDRNIRSVAEGKGSVWQTLSLIGLRMETQIKEKIGSNIQPANHPYTIAKKKSSRTLIDTSAMIQNVRYVVRSTK